MACRLGPGTQPCHPQQPCWHLHLQLKAPLLWLCTLHYTIPTSQLWLRPIHPSPHSAKLSGDCYKECFSLYSTNALYLLSLPLLLSAPSTLSLLFLASLFSFGKEVGGNNDWKTSFRPHAGSAGEEERDGDCLLQQHLCHSFCTSQRRKTRPGSERGGDGRGSPIPKGISSINQVSASRLIKSFRMTYSRAL